MKTLSLPLIAALMLVPALAAANSGDFSGGVAVGTSYAGVYTSPTNGLIVQGDVGIGVTSPGSPLVVVGVANFQGSSGVGAIQVNGAGGSWFWIDNPSTHILRFSSGATAGTNPVVIGDSGYIGVGIGNTSPSYLLQVGGSSASGVVMQLQNSSGACTYNPGASSVTVSCSSDMRLKSNIQDSKGALAWVDDLRVRDFTVKATGERRTGVVAQEVALKHPEMVHKNAEGTYLVDEPSPWKLVRAIQEQQDEIDQLKKTIEQLKQQQ